MNQGNVGETECGTITGGPCDGDELWGTAAFEVDDQEGCSCSGIRGQTAIARTMVVRGKCASRCSLGSSISTYAPGFNNWGIVMP